MPQMIEVSFKGNRREFFVWGGEEPPALRTPVIVEVDRGEDLGVVHATGELAAQRKAGTTHGKAAPATLTAALRLATAADVAIAESNRVEEDVIRRRAIEKVRSQQLEMKVSDTEWQWDRRKLTIYFTAEKRIDFRQLVRQLETSFGARVQMWHIGVRDEARRLDGVGRCARQFCSASWLPELRPVKSSVAKDQRLSTLNPAQISGTCGRLMCCLRYEHEFYVAQRKRFPKEGKIITTLAGEEKVVSNDIFREQVTLRDAAGESRTIPLTALHRELGGEFVEHVVDAPSSDDGDEEDELTAESRAPQRAAPRAPQRTPPPSAPRTEATRPPRTESPRPPRNESRPARDESRPERPERPERPVRPERPRRPSGPPIPERPVPAASTPPVPDAAALPPTDETDDTSPDAGDETDVTAPQGGEGGLRRRRRRGRRGGRRGREGGAPPAGGGTPDTPPTTGS